MSLPVLLLLEGLAYALLVGGLAWLRREGLSMRFAVETILLTLIVSGATALTGFQTHPVIFLIFLYLFTYRVRLIVDLGTIFAKRGNYQQADSLYRLAQSLWPDQTGRTVVLVNLGTMRLQQGNLDEAITLFKDVLAQSAQGYLGVKYEAATHYNLAVAYRRQNNEARAIAEFNAAIDTFPGSEYARRAGAALERQYQKDHPSANGG